MSSERTIQCPWCKEGEVYWGLPCLVCHDRGVVIDRRKPTANDKAVERIRSIIDAESPCAKYDKGYNTALWIVRNIIREEAERG